MKSGNKNVLKDGFARDLKGEIITPANLPSPETKRWTPKLKASLVRAVEGGVLTVQDLLERYRMSIEELMGLGWGFELHGVDGLKVKHTQRFRPTRHAA